MCIHDDFPKLSYATIRIFEDDLPRFIAIYPLVNVYMLIVKSQCSMGKSTIGMAIFNIFNSKLLVYQKVPRFVLHDGNHVKSSAREPPFSDHFRRLLLRGCCGLIKSCRDMSCSSLIWVRCVSYLVQHC